MEPLKNKSYFCTITEQWYANLNPIVLIKLHDAWSSYNTKYEIACLIFARS